MNIDSWRADFRTPGGVPGLTAAVIAGRVAKTWALSALSSCVSKGRVLFWPRRELPCSVSSLERRIWNQTIEDRAGTATGYNYDRENRLQVLVEPDSSRTTMVYDADGLRRVKQTASATTTYVWDGSDYLGEVQ